MLTSGTAKQSEGTDEEEAVQQHSTRCGDKIWLQWFSSNFFPFFWFRLYVLFPKEETIYTNTKNLGETRFSLIFFINSNYISKNVQVYLEYFKIKIHSIL